MKIISLSILAVAIAASSAAAAPVVQTPAYRWTGDSVVQGRFSATAPSDFEIVSDYFAVPGYFMPIEQRWTPKNDLSALPRVSSSNKLLNAAFNMALDEMINAVEPDTTLRTGKEWAGVWTRDVSYSIILSMAYMQPEASMISLMHKVRPDGRIIQDTGSGGAWPVSSDRQVWTLAANELYKVTGDKKWLAKVYPIAARSIDDDLLTLWSPDSLVRGETSFIDWREQSYPKWMQTADIYSSEASSTNIVHAAALRALSEMAAELGKKDDAKRYGALADALAARINEEFWLPESGHYAMYRYGRDNLILNPRAETLGAALAVLYDVASPEQQQTLTQKHPVTPFGAPIFFPQIEDMRSYHNNALWPFVASYWALANAKTSNEEGTLQAIGSVIRPAALFATNKENLNLDNGDIQTELNSSNMLWSLSGNIALTTRILFGIHFEKDGLRFAPFVPEALADTRRLENFPYRGAKLDITVSGFGSRIKSLSLNGKTLDPADPFIPASKLKGDCAINIEMDCVKPAPMTVNAVANSRAPLTPLARLEHDPALDAADVPVLNLLAWNPIEYIGSYIVLRDGKPVATTRTTTWPATEPGEWQVIGVSSDGVESFASEPVSNRERIEIQLPGEGLTVGSAEVSYAPTDTLAGYHGDGFVEIDKAVQIEPLALSVPADGVYAVQLRYANGNGPVNTENKAAIRSLLIDGKKVGTVVLPQRGVANWNDWGLSNSVHIPLTAGDHELTLEYRTEDRNMNLHTNHALIDAVLLTRTR